MIKGRLCETSIDPCTNNPCQNNALCLSTSTGYKCVCSSSIYTGSLCEINQNPCQYSPCQNGICQLLGNTSSFRCICYPGYTGQFCHIKINYCLSQPCENNGICANVATGFVCTCLANFTGLTCSIRINSCLTEPCFDDNNNNNHNQMICPEGFTKLPNCLEDINECLLETEPCKNSGQCINTIGSYYCQCNEYYQGNDCSIPIDPCLSNPCTASNSISCTSIINNRNVIDFNCTCRVGFAGKS
jgi:Notch-like protein